MNEVTWTHVREYIEAEIALRFARLAQGQARAMGAGGDVLMALGERVSELEEQSSRMETAVREALP